MSQLRLIIVKLKAWPSNVTEEDVASFVADALSTWGGQRHPDDPLFNSLDIESIQIGGASNGTRFIVKEFTQSGQ